MTERRGELTMPPPAAGEVPGSPASAAVALAIVVRGLTKSYPGQIALNRVSLTIQPGEVHGLVGENGSGKSTFIKALAGYHRPDAGTVDVGNVPLTFGSPRESHRLGLRFVHQNLGLIEQCNAVENIVFGTKFRYAFGRIDWPYHEAQVRSLLARLNIECDPWRPVGELSPIERTAVAVARAMNDAGGSMRLLVLDEPTAALTPTEVTVLFRLIRDLKAHGVAVLYVSHRLNELIDLTDRITVLRDGVRQATVDTAGLDVSRITSLIVGEQSDALPQPSVVKVPTQIDIDRPALRVSGVRASGFDGLNLTLGRGEIIGLAGLMGAGHEEALGALFGSRPATFDFYEVNGAEIGAVTPRAMIGHGVALVPGNRRRGSAVHQMSLRENLLLPPSGHRLRRSAQRPEARRWIADMDIRPRDPERLFAKFSGGNQQKILLAKWVRLAPSVLLVEEPTAGVDVGARAIIFDILRRWAAAGGSLILTSSDLGDYEAICGRVVLFTRGQVSTILDEPSAITEQGIFDALLAAEGAHLARARAGVSDGATTIASSGAA